MHEIWQHIGGVCVNELALFAGAGGGILGGHLLGWRTVCAVEWNAYAASVLCARQNDQALPPFPIWDDVQTFDGKPWRGIVDCVSGGFPCQDISVAGGGQESPGSDLECGNTWLASLARLDPDTRLWKTAQCSLLEDSTSSLPTLPRWGSMRNGALFQRQIPALRTSESVFGFSLPTPVSSDGTSGSVIGKNDTFYTTSTGMPRKVNQKGTDGSVGLGRLVQMWPTPTANEDACGKPTGKMQKMLGNHPQVRQDPNGGMLNPVWVEWLMGWPLGWTDLKPLEMDKFREWQQLHSSCFVRDGGIKEAE